MELVLVPFVLPLLLLGRLLDLLESRRLPRVREIDAATWRRTWFSFQGRPRIADRAPDPPQRHQGERASDGA
jgi:hypothetical protein